MTIASRTADRSVPISLRTGEPRLPIPVVIGAILAAAAATCVIISIALVLWRAVHDYAAASWLMAFAEIHKPEWVTALDAKHPPVWSGWRILMVFGAALAAVLLVASLTIPAFYALRGYAWSKWAGLIAICISPLAAGLNWWAWAASAGAILLTAALWLPTSRRFFATWTARRGPAPFEATPRGVVQYGPLPRYRS